MYKNHIRVFLIAVACLIAAVFIQVQKQATSVSDISHWSIVGDEHKILWQKKVPCLSISTHLINAAVAVSQQAAVFHQSCILESSLISLNLLTGKQEWSVPAFSSFQILGVKDGYINLEGDTTLVKYSLAGDVLWHSKKFPSHSVREAFIKNNLIYLPNSNVYVPNGNGIQVISADTGQDIKRIDDETFLTEFENLYVSKEDNKIKILDTQSDRSIVTALKSYQGIIAVDFLDDILLVHFGRSNITAYNINTGDILWEISGEFKSAPLLLEDHLYTYNNSDQLEIYNPKTGMLLKSIQLKSSGSQRTSVNLAGYGNKIVICFYGVYEIIAINIKL